MIYLKKCLLLVVKIELENASVCFTMFVMIPKMKSFSYVIR